MKRLLASVARKLYSTARALLLVPSVDDNLLADFRFVPDAELRPRLTFAIPDIDPRRAFGGVRTGIDLFVAIAAEMDRRTAIDLRILLTRKPDSAALVVEAAEKHGIDPGRIAIEVMSDRQGDLSLRRHDLVMAFDWSWALNIQAPMRARSQLHGDDPLPLVYLIQEYEPHLLTFSAAHMFARDALDRADRLWGLFNGASLHAYVEQMGHRPDRAFVFEPVIDDRLRAFLPEVDVHPRQRQLVVYGRPGIDRNCFPALVRGLREWARAYPEYREWNVVSAVCHIGPLPWATDDGSRRWASSRSKIMRGCCWRVGLGSV